MKFSYSIFKKLVPVIKNKVDLVDKLENHLFEVESVAGDILDIKILPNRYSDAACYFGLSREISTIYNRKFIYPKSKFLKPEINNGFKISIRTPKTCRRFMAQYFNDIKIGLSPKWLKEALEKSGIRSINNIVDITNYVTLETGQPLHAFDFDKINGAQINVRLAKEGEMVAILDGNLIKLNSNTMVLSDKNEPLDIAGIKGGKKAEITELTKNILLTAGNFDGVSIYNTSKKINLVTDASVRFSHNISPNLVEMGLSRAAELIKQICGGKAGQIRDVYAKKSARNIIKFDIEKFNKMSGLSLNQKTALEFLKKSGFIIKGLLVEPSPIRTDISLFEDLVEEIVRLYGYEKLKAHPPRIVLQPSGHEDRANLKDKIRSILVKFGLSEVCNYSFSGKGDIKLENPVDKDLSFLRHSLKEGLMKNIYDNFRFFKRVSIFEIGKVFTYPDKESTILGIAIGDKKDREFFELKGIVDQLLNGLGLTDYFMREETPNRLRIESSHHVIGYIQFIRDKDYHIFVSEINLDRLLQTVVEEKEYEPISKYPSISRDISLLLEKKHRINKIMEIIENSAPAYLNDVDFIDSYESEELGENMQSLTFRLVFLSNERTLTDREVDGEMDKIVKSLQEQINAEIR